MKLIISENQYKKIREQFDTEDFEDEENNVMGNPSESTLLVADFLVRENIVDIDNIDITDDTIRIYGFKNERFEYFLDNFLDLEVLEDNGDIHVDVSGVDYGDEDEGDRVEVYFFIENLAEAYPFIIWYIEGDKI